METVDVIVVGAGSAGCIVAARLAEAGHSVCVIEDGSPDRNIFIKIPAGFMKTLFDPKVTWQMLQNPGEAIGGRQIPVIQGRTLGGSGSVNGMIYNRGQAADFDQWAQLGNPGWGYADVLPHFKQIETWDGPANPDYRGDSGPMAITVPSWPSAASDAFVAAANAAGVPSNPDHNAAVQEGVGLYQSAIRKGRRVSSADAYLRPAMRQHGLRLLTGCRVTRINIADGRATGIQYCRHGDTKPQTLSARHSVVISAGAINTPRLLQLSGIGPAEMLAERGVTSLVDLPGVGENLRDHYSPRIAARTLNKRDSMNGRESGLPLVGEIIRWLTGRPNILAISPALLNVFWKSRADLAAPDFTLTFTPASYRRGYIGKLDTYPGVTCGAWVMRPESKGFVRIKGPNPFTDPEIDARYLSAETDQQITITALKFARKLLASEAMKQVIVEETFPGLEVQSDADWLDFARAEGNSSNHLIGTARMGPKDDRGAVVDARLRVHGVAGLRVMDCTVMPTMPSANTWAASLMIGEKGAAMLIADLAK